MKKYISFICLCIVFYYRAIQADDSHQNVKIKNVYLAYSNKRILQFVIFNYYISIRWINRRNYFLHQHERHEPYCNYLASTIEN